MATVYIIDDEDTIQYLYKEALSLEGHKIVGSASNGLKAIEDIDIEANGAAATTEVIESVVLIFPETDVEMEDPEHNKLGVTVRAWAKTTGVGPITAAYFYYTIGSNDSYIDIPFV